MVFIHGYIVKRENNTKFDGMINFYEDLLLVWDEEQMTSMKKANQAGIIVSPMDCLSVLRELDITDFTIENQLYANTINQLFGKKSSKEKVDIAIKMAKDQSIDLQVFFKSIVVSFQDELIQITPRCFIVTNKEIMAPFAMKLNELFVCHEG